MGLNAPIFRGPAGRGEEYFPIHDEHKHQLVPRGTDARSSGQAKNRPKLLQDTAVEKVKNVIFFNSPPFPPIWT